MRPPKTHCSASRCTWAALLIAGLFSAFAQSADLDLRVEGVSGDILANVEATLQMSRYLERDVSTAQIKLLYQAADEQIHEALRPFGYYNAAIERSLSQTAAEQFVASFTIELGAPVIVNDLHVEVRGPAASLAPLRAALDSFQPRQGERLVHAAYEESKAEVDAALRAAGFLDAKLVTHRIAVSRSENAADIEVVWRSGERYRFGEVSFSQSQFSDRFLDAYAPWRPGDPYSAAAVMELQRRLVSADYFSLVSVQPDVQQPRDRRIPVHVLLEPDERNVYAANIYASTDTGPGARFEYERRWLNSRGHKLRGALEYSDLLEEAALTYVLPQPGAERRDYTFGAAYTDEQTDSSRSQMTTIAAAEAREEWRGFNRTLGVQYVESDFVIGGARGSSDLLFAEAALIRTRADDYLFPTRGYGVTVALRASPGAALSDTDLLQLQIDGKVLGRLTDDDRLIARGEIGAMTVGDFDALPPRLRFFAGGDRSIRGFDYQSIGARNAQGEVIGGKYVATASLEYERFILPKWGAAAFVDAGDAFTEDFDLHIGAGLGARWKSPIGVVRLDFAYGLEGASAQGWRFHLLIGPDL